MLRSEGLELHTVTFDDCCKVLFAIICRCVRVH